MKHFNFFLNPVNMLCCMLLAFTGSALGQYSQFDTLSKNVSASLPASDGVGLTHSVSRHVKVLNTVPGAEPLRPVYLGAANRYIGNPKGYFNTYKDANGVWYLVDPEGYLFYSVGVNQIKKNPSSTISAQIDDLKNNFGINTAGNWTDETGFRNMPFTFKFNFMQNYSNGGTIHNDPQDYRRWKLYQNGIMPLFEDVGETFQAYCTQVVTDSITDALKTNKMLIGYFSDNEIELGTSSSKSSLLVEYMDSLNYKGFTGELGVQDPNYKATLNWVAARHSGPITNQDKLDFVGYIADVYYNACRTAIRSKDTNHLYIGSRLHRDLTSAALFDAARNNLDIVTVNYYRNWNPSPTSISLWSGNGLANEKPVLITEFYAADDNTGLKNRAGAGWVVNNQQERADFYENFTLGLLAEKNCVGFHWFKYSDDPHKNPLKPNDPDKSKNAGIYDTTLNAAWTPLKNSFKKINQNIYNIRSWRLNSDTAPAGSIERDAYVRAGQYYQTNYGTETFIEVKESPDNLADYRRRGLIRVKIDKTNIASVSQITSAKLKLYSNSNSLLSTSTATVSLYKVVPADWYQTTITYDNAPTKVKTVALTSTDLVKTVTMQGRDKYIEFDITNDIKDLYSSAYDGRSYMIIATNATSGEVVRFNSMEATVNKPVLEINNYSYKGVNVVKGENINLNLNSDDSSVNSLSLFPNPVKNTLNLSCGANEQLSLQVYNLSGQLVKTIHTMSDKTSGIAQDVSFLNPGMYVLKVYGTISGRHQMRFIKE